VDVIKRRKHDEDGMGGQATDILDSIEDPTLSVNKESKIVYVNHATERLFDKERSELIGKSIWDVLPKNIRNALDFYYHKALTGGKPSKCEAIKLFNSRCDINFYPVQDGIAIFIHDITTKWHTEELYRLSLYLIERLNENIFLVRSDGRLFHVNDETCKTLGYSLDELIHMKIFEIDPSIDAEKWDDYFADIKKKGSVTYESELIAKDGKTYPVEVNANYILLYEIEYYCVAARDISERKKISNALEDAKSQSELYVDLMGHDINNMNQVGIGYIELALENPDLDEKTRALLTKPLEVLQSSSKLIENVRKLQQAKAGDMLFKEMDLGDVLKEVQSGYATAPGGRVKIDYTYKGGCRVLANELIIDVFSNLMGNSVKHSKDPLAINLQLININENNRDYCKVVVEDNGPGIADNQKSRLFTRFSRGDTRASGRGLGLFLVKSIVEDYHGKVWVEDRVPGDHTKGARFVVMLPAAEK
jgi:PAS domain S-box-containing protein